MCVQDVDVQCVLQFTLIHAAGCALHRPPSRVIHHLELSKSKMPIRSVAARNEVRRPTPEKSRGGGLACLPTPPRVLCKKLSVYVRKYILGCL